MAMTYSKRIRKRKLRKADAKKLSYGSKWGYDVSRAGVAQLRRHNENIRKYF